MVYTQKVGVKMLYFLYQFYQGIAHGVFTLVDFTKNGIDFLTTFTADMQDAFTGIDFPPLVVAVLSLVFALGLFDKITHLLKG